MDRLRSLTPALALGALTCLLAMVAVTLTTGASQEWFEVTRPAAEYGAALRTHAGALRILFALDSVFLVLYATFFVGFARCLASEDSAGWLRIGVGFVLATAVLDMIEDHHILAMLAAAEHGDAPSPDRIALQHVLSQVKFHLSYLGLFVFGLAVPRDRWVGRALARLLTVGTLALGAMLYAVPARWLPALDLARWIGFVTGFVLAIAYLRLPSGRAAGSGAPA